MRNKIWKALVLTGSLAFSLSAQVPAERNAEQQERIAQGERSGELTGSEARHLEHKENHIKREVRRDRRENGGTLTPSEKAKVNRQQNRASHDIARDKHNDAVN